MQHYIIMLKFIVDLKTKTSNVGANEHWKKDLNFSVYNGSGITVITSVYLKGAGFRHPSFLCLVVFLFSYFQKELVLLP